MSRAINYVASPKEATPLIALNGPIGNMFGSGLSRLWGSKTPVAQSQRIEVKSDPTDLSEKTLKSEGSTPQIRKNDSQGDGNPAEDSNFYAIYVGREPGVVRGTDTLKANTEGIPGAQVCKFDTEQEAVAAFHAALIAYRVQRVTVLKAEHTLDNSHLPTIPGVQPGSTINPGKHWAVIVGRTPGVFGHPADVSGNLTGIPGAHCQKCTSYAEVVTAFHNALSAKQVKMVVYNIGRETLTPAHFS
ncbi:hypothetical protein GALMADRAFT_135599 [Galerina marginata CBS 339.88]|uniref:Ribonuclease H1 N-terminal domain-containing protein n=1 Tax=Galerina marginata (strain CBS 339.88) TaxID=685588 RepID=A0A067TG87_GALM3|nr:hypothetical protein GALMADRAFT_135599 [Galerina marginata CBS 339.88]